MSGISGGAVVHLSPQGRRLTFRGSESVPSTSNNTNFGIFGEVSVVSVGSASFSLPSFADPSPFCQRSPPSFNGRIWGGREGIYGKFCEKLDGGNFAKN